MEEKSREQELSVREISLIRELTQIRKEHKRELEYEKFDGYELPPRTQFSMLNKPAVSIKYGVMKFNMACIRLFEVCSSDFASKQKTACIDYVSGRRQRVC